jgi:hypothetical protein
VRRRDDPQRLLRWYPTEWRARYGGEFLALVEDRLHEAPLTIRRRSSIAFAGVRERCYGSGLFGSRSTPSTQRRSGSLTVMVAWSIMIVGGASLAKTAEHFSSALPASSRFAARFSYDTVAVAGLVGTLLVFAGAVVALPGFLGFLRDHKWASVRAFVSRSVMATIALIGATFGLSTWAHDLNAAQRNGGDDWYSAAFVAFVLLAVVTVGLWTGTGVAVASRINFSVRALRFESRLAIGACLASLAVLGGAVAWWTQMALHAPWFLEGTPVGTTSSPWSLQLVITLLMMTFGALSGVWGAWRVAMTFRPARLNGP